MTIEVRPLAYGLGAEVAGVDATRTLDPDTVAQVRQAWLDHLILVFPGQHIDLAQHIAFSRHFGELEQHPERHLRHKDHPEIFEVTNRIVGGQRSETANVGRSWHSDGAFTVRPPTGSLLHCLAVPDVGGDTWFTNMYMAYETLSPVMQQVVDQLEVVNDLSFAAELKLHDQTKLAEDLKQIPPVVQPMVRVHPETGRKALYLNETVTRQIHGMTIEEGRGLLDFLYRHCVQAEFTYRHRWRPGDIVMWDNRCTMHLAPADYDPAKLRHMCRTTLLGEPLGRVYGANH
jgi:taurine dioxygenase